MFSFFWPATRSVSVTISVTISERAQRFAGKADAILDAIQGKKALVVVLGLGLAAGLLLVPLPGHWRGLWQGKLLDLAHVPLFAALTLFLASMLGRGLIRPVLIALALAGVSELLQEAVGRAGDLFDFLRGACGALAAAAGVRAWQLRRRPLPVLGCLILLAGLLAWPLRDALPYLVDAYEGAQAFPTLTDFSTGRQRLRWKCRQAELTRVADPRHPDAWAGRVQFFPGPETYSYAALRPILRDFSAYRVLCCSFTVRDEPLELTISIRSGPGEADKTTHYQTGRTYPAGEHVVRLNLADIAPRANPHPLDLSDVWIIQFFLDRPQKTHTLSLHRIWLEE